MWWIYNDLAGRNLSGLCGNRAWPSCLGNLYREGLKPLLFVVLSRRYAAPEDQERTHPAGGEIPQVVRQDGEPNRRCNRLGIAGRQRKTVRLGDDAQNKGQNWRKACSKRDYAG